MTGASNRGVTIRMFLVDGAPQGLRLVERTGWTGSCLAFARSDYARARERTELQRTGVYVLVGPDPDGQRTQRAYVGEADRVRTRLDMHQKEKDFWTHAYVFTTSDDSLNKAHVRYMEARLLAMAKQADNAALDNGTAQGPTWLSEPETADMEAYLDFAQVLFPLVGVNVFEAAETPVQAKGDLDELDAAATPDTGATLFLRNPLTEARGRDDSRGFLVHEGSLARLEEKVMLDSYRRVRSRLINEGILVPEGADQLRMTKSFIFESPSAAASVLSGGSKNGRTEWKDARGRTLKQLQEQSAS